MHPAANLTRDIDSQPDRAGTARAALRWVATLIAAGALAAISVASARAATGASVLPATAIDGPITVFYPTAADAAPTQRGPFTVNIAANGVPGQGNGRLIVVSHGSGASAWVYNDLANTCLLQAISHKP